jgi:hypothetical protein
MLSILLKLDFSAAFKISFVWVPVWMDLMWVFTFFLIFLVYIFLIRSLHQRDVKIKLCTGGHKIKVKYFLQLSMIQ